MQQAGPLPRFVEDRLFLWQPANERGLAGNTAAPQFDLFIFLNIRSLNLVKQILEKCILFEANI